MSGFWFTYKKCKNSEVLFRNFENYFSNFQATFWWCGLSRADLKITLVFLEVRQGWEGPKAKGKTRHRIQLISEKAERIRFYAIYTINRL